ncbi:DUF4199 domain-containing protein [Sporocytophaga myxococcoides]|uniref:DUF4199 domain-containing protein n=1 Tax=Sporocytophaga myxococcoides TaxID=153721 RepID=UPI0003FF069A|nr:DUF4199 domain-containing protein [Sporocytophaga myxococcoides]
MDKRVSYGLISGSAAGIWLVVYYEYLYQISLSFSIVAYLILAAGIYLGSKKAKESIYNGKISFSQSVMAGVIISFFAGLSWGLFSYAYAKWINPDLGDFFVKETISSMQKSGLKPDEIAKQVENIKKGFSPGQQLFTTAFFTTLIGLMISLVVSIIIRNRDPHYPSMPDNQDKNKSDNDPTNDINLKEVK